MVRTPCSIPNCSSPVPYDIHETRLCYSHAKQYAPNIIEERLKRRRELERCKVDGCNLSIQRRGLCRTHLREKFPELWAERNEAYNQWFKQRYHGDPDYKEQYLQNRSSKSVGLLKKWRFEVLSHYSEGKLVCECCDEMTIEFLSIDHINGRGKDDNMTGYKLYSWLIRNSFPPGYRVLCHNCNQALGYYGYCPHQKQKTDSKS